MRIGLGIDTGGTYTDIVAYDYDAKQVVCKSKTLTTKEDLTLCISRSLDALPKDILEQAVSLSLSTTLATNACVENRGGRAKLVLMGMPAERLQSMDVKGKYGIDLEETLSFDTNSSFDGEIVDIPNWAQVLSENEQFFASAQSLAFSEVNALRNNGAVEKSAHDYFANKLGVPVVTASDLAYELNFLERGATAQLNARLLPVISRFISAVGQVLEQRGLDIPVMILRSDGSLMSKASSQQKPVETILCGPAASVIGGKGLTTNSECLIVDIGGTTTDISIVHNGVPVMTNSIKIGGWRTQVKGVFINTFGLGGDSRVYTEKDKVKLGANRVVPVCMLAQQYPYVTKQLEKLVHEGRKTIYPMHEFLYIQHMPSDTSNYTDYEKHLLDVLADGPVILGDPRIDIYRVHHQRLEQEGVLMRAGLTPTDVMHVRGDFDKFETHASLLAVQHFANNYFPSLTEDEQARGVRRMCDMVYELFEHKLYCYIAYALLEYRYPQQLKNGIGEQLRKLVDEFWESSKSDASSPLVNLGMNVDAALVGIGAPTHVFLPNVAKAMGAECVIPQDAEVANAIGAAIASVSAEVVIEVAPKYGPAGVEAYVVRAHDGSVEVEDYTEAVNIATKAAEREAIEEARARGAKGELNVDVDVKSRRISAMYGDEIYLGTKVIGHATQASGL